MFCAPSRGSVKGQQQAVVSAQRPARRRAGKARQRGLSREQVPILVVRNRAGQTTDSVLEIADKVSVSHMLRIAVAAVSAPPRPSNVRRRTHRNQGTESSVRTPVSIDAVHP